MDSGKEAKKQTGRWSEEQHQRFMMGIATYGKDWKKVEELVATRTGSQVRSHAQKFFNKLHKEKKEKKNEEKESRQKNNNDKDRELFEKQNQLDEGSESFNELLKGYNEEGSNSTPIELLSIIKSHTDNNKTNLHNLKKELMHNIQVIEEEGEEKQLDPPMLMSRNSFKSMNNIISAYENVKDEKGEPEEKDKEKQKEKESEKKEKVELEDQSFLILLTKKYKKYFAKGGNFSNLIDFGSSGNVQQFERSIRKRSFTLPEGVEGDEDDLNERKKRVIADSNLGEMNEQQKDSFREAMFHRKEEQERERELQEKENPESKEIKETKQGLLKP